METFTWDELERSFGTRFKEHYLSYKHHNQNLKFSHLQKSRHSIGPIDEVMELVQVVSKGNVMNFLGKVYIYI